MQSERQLVRRMARRDRSAWAVMYDRHVGEVYGLAYHLLGGDRAVAEEVTQEVWLLAIERFRQFEPGRGEFRDWVLGIARNHALRRFRRAGHRDRAARGRDGVTVAADLPPQEQLEEKERAGMVRAALLSLPEDRRAVLLQKYTEGLTVSEIAARSGRSAKAVESLLSRARDQLRELLWPYISDWTGGECHEPTDARSAR